MQTGSSLLQPPPLRWTLAMTALWACCLLLLFWSNQNPLPCNSRAARRDADRAGLAASRAAAAAGAPAPPDGEYWAARSRLLTADQLLATGGATVLHGRERRVNALLTRLKRAEFAAANFTAGGHFFNVRDDIRRSPVFSVIRRMPKGAMLHIHDLSMLSAEKLVANITYMDHLYVCNSTQVSGEPDVRLQFFDRPDNSCDEWRLLSDDRRALGAGPVDAWLLRHLSMEPRRPEDEYPELGSVWAAFKRVMSAVRGLIRYEAAWRRYTELALHELLEDNIQYVEIRSTLPELCDLSGRPYPPERTVEVYEEALAAVRRRDARLFGGRVILATSRHVTPEQVAADVSEVLRLRARHPALVAGFDLVGEEDDGAPLRAFVPQLLRLPREGVPTFYHAGETYWQGTSVDENLYDAVLLNASRIGHGYGIVKHPRLLAEVVRRGIAIEVCPISNQVLGLVSDLRNHPAAALLAADAPLVVSADDPGSWGAAGLSYDLYMAFMALAGRRADLGLLKRLALNSVRYSSLPVTEKEQLGMVWQHRWDQFLDAVIREHELSS